MANYLPIFGSISIEIFLLSSQCQTARAEMKADLTALAQRQFEEESRAGEDEQRVFQQFFQKVQEGKQIFFTKALPGIQLGTGETIKAEWIVWLCGDTVASTRVNRDGINIIGAKIEGALDLSWLRIQFPLRFQHCQFTHGVILSGANLRTLSLLGSHIDSRGGKESLIGDDLTVQGEIDLTGLNTDGPASFRSAVINGQLKSRDAQYLSPRLDFALSAFAPALDLSSAKFGNGVDLYNAHISAVQADDCDIKGDLNCANAYFGSPHIQWDSSFVGNSLVITGSVYFDALTVYRPVKMRRASIGKDLYCRLQTVKTLPQNFDAGAAKIGGDVIVELPASTRDTCIFNFSATEIAGTFWLQRQSTPLKQTAVLDLSDAKVGTLINDESGWPNVGRLRIQGFVFGELGGKTPPDIEKQLRWLGLQTPWVYQPYEEMSTVLRNMGYQEDALTVETTGKWNEGCETIRKDWGLFVHSLQHSQVTHSLLIFLRIVFYDVLWFFVLGWLIGYGYRPWNALLVSIFFITFGTGLFNVAERNEVLTKSREDKSNHARDLFHDE